MGRKKKRKEKEEKEERKRKKRDSAYMMILKRATRERTLFTRGKQNAEEKHKRTSVRERRRGRENHETLRNGGGM